MKVDLTESEILTMQIIIAASFRDHRDKASFEHVRELAHIYDKLEEAKQEVTE